MPMNDARRSGARVVLIPVVLTFALGLVSAAGAAIGVGPVGGAPGFDHVESLAFDPNTNTLFGTAII